MTPLQLTHNHDGRCSGHLRLAGGAIVREIVCDDCKAIVQTLGKVK